jgi:dihydropteroate synthase
MHVSLPSRILDLSDPVVMGIVNVTPDSFSDAGHYRDASAAIDDALAMVDAGAGIIDIGGESTRPGSNRVPAEVQLDRVLPVLEGLRRNPELVLSVDTGDAVVIREVMRAGADMINDVFGLREPGALQAAGDSGAAVCLMHMQGSPQTMQERPAYTELPADIVDFLAARVETWQGAGFATNRLVLDPGFGFGKLDEHNLTLLATLAEFTDLGLPVLVGLSRKATLGRLTGRKTADRQAAGIAAAVIAVERGANIVRTHDVPATVDALRIVSAVKSASVVAQRSDRSGNKRDR